MRLFNGRPQASSNARELWMLRIQCFGFEEDFPCGFRHVGVQCGGCAQQTSFRPPSSHPRLESLPLARGGMTVGHTRRDCKFRAQPYPTLL